MSCLSGWIYDRWGPRVCTVVGGLLAGSGFFLSVFAHSVPAIFMSFGVIVGLGASSLLKLQRHKGAAPNSSQENESVDNGP